MVKPVKERQYLRNVVQGENQGCYQGRTWEALNMWVGWGWRREKEDQLEEVNRRQATIAEVKEREMVYVTDIMKT